MELQNSSPISLLARQVRVGSIRLSPKLCFFVKLTAGEDEEKGVIEETGEWSDAGVAAIVGILPFGP